LNHDNEYWKKVQQNFEKKTQEMWQEDWFCDFDKRSKHWVKNKDYYDVTNLVPFFANIFNEDQLNKAHKWFEYFKNNPKYWLEWASFFFMYIEACWNIGFKELASEVLFLTADRVYKNWDRRSWKDGESMPGISVECWGHDKPYGAEGYGWAATLPLHIIRSLAGFREYKPDFQNSFLLCPNFPGQLIIPGNTYLIQNLKFQDKVFSINYEIMNEREFICHFSSLSKTNCGLSVLDEDEQVIDQSEVTSIHHEIQIEMKNRESYRFVFLEIA